MEEEEEMVVEGDETKKGVEMEWHWKCGMLHPLLHAMSSRLLSDGSHVCKAVSHSSNLSVSTALKVFTGLLPASSSTLSCPSWLEGAKQLLPNVFAVFNKDSRWY